MSTLVIAQTNNAGVQMSATPNHADTTNIVITFVSSVFDSLGSIDKSFPATSVAPGSFQLTDADLTTLFGEVNLASMQAGGLSPALSMSASQFNGAGAEVELAQTTIAGATALNQMNYLQFDLPLAPLEVSVSPSNNKLIIVATVFSQNPVSDQIKVTVHKTAPGALGTITNSTITGIPGPVVNGVNTFTFEVTPLDNGEQYEIFAKFANIGADGLLQYGPRNVVAFTGEPNDNAGLVSAVTVTTALLNGAFDSTNAANLNADWAKTETSPTQGQPTSYKMYVAKSDGSVSLEVAQPDALAADTDAIVTLAPALIPRSWFGGATSIDVKVAIKEYFADGSSKLGNMAVDNTTVFQMIMPTLGPVNMDSVDPAGLQTMSVTSTALGAGVYAISQTFNGADTGNTTNTATLDYAAIDAAANKEIVFTHSVVDANDLNTPYSVTSSATLYAFMDPVGPATPTISVASFNADPVIGFVKAANNNNNGYAISSYKIDVEYVVPAGNTAAIYGNPYSANFSYTNMPVSLTATATNTAAPYIAGDFKVTVSSVFSIGNIPALYTHLHNHPPMSASSTVARWWTRPTIDSIDVLGPNMTSTGNNGGATYTVVNTNAITSIGFTGTSDDSTLSKKSMAMPAASLGAATDRDAAGLFAFTALLIHDDPLIDLSGDYLDGLGFVDADNAPSALSVAVFNTAAIAEHANQSAIGVQIAALQPLIAADAAAQTELSDEQALLVTLQGTAGTAQTTYDAAVLALTDPDDLAADAAAALTAKGTADSAKVLADALVVSTLATLDQATADQVTAQTAKDDADAEVTTLEGNPMSIANTALLAAAYLVQTDANAALVLAIDTTAAAQLAYDNAVTAAGVAATAATNAANASTAADLALATANAAVTTAQTALTAANLAVTQSQARIVIDQTAADAAAATLAAQVALIQALPGYTTIAGAEQAVVTAAALALASRTTNPTLYIA